MKKILLITLALLLAFSSLAFAGGTTKPEQKPPYVPTGLQSSHIPEIVYIAIREVHYDGSVDGTMHSTLEELVNFWTSGENFRPPVILGEVAIFKACRMSFREEKHRKDIIGKVWTVDSFTPAPLVLRVEEIRGTYYDGMLCKFSGTIMKMEDLNGKIYYHFLGVPLRYTLQRIKVESKIVERCTKKTKQLEWYVVDE